MRKTLFAIAALAMSMTMSAQKVTTVDLYVSQGFPGSNSGLSAFKRLTFSLLHSLQKPSLSDTKKGKSIPVDTK